MLIEIILIAWYGYILKEDTSKWPKNKIFGPNRSNQGVEFMFSPKYDNWWNTSSDKKLLSLQDLRVCTFTFLSINIILYAVMKFQAS